MRLRRSSPARSRRPRRCDDGHTAGLPDGGRRGWRRTGSCAMVDRPLDGELLPCSRAAMHSRSDQRGVAARLRRDVRCSPGGRRGSALDRLVQRPQQRTRGGLVERAPSTPGSLPHDPAPNGARSVTAHSARSGVATGLGARTCREPRPPGAVHSRPFPPGAPPHRSARRVSVVSATVTPSDGPGSTYASIEGFHASIEGFLARARKFHAPRASIHIETESWAAAGSWRRRRRPSGSPP